MVLKVMMGSILLIISIVVAGFLNLTDESENHLEYRNQLQSLYTAEAGIERALDMIASGRLESIGSQASPMAFEFGHYFVTCIDNGKGIVSIRSTGIIGKRHRTIEVVVRCESSSNGVPTFKQLSWQQIDDHE